MILDVQRVFDKEIARIFHTRDDIKRFFLTHDRKPECVRRLCAQIQTYELKTARPSRHQYIDMIKSVAKMFCEAALKSKDQDLLTEAERMRQVSEFDRNEEIKKEIKIVTADGKIEPI